MRSHDYERRTYQGSGLEGLDPEAPQISCLSLLNRWWIDAVADERVSEPSAAALATYDQPNGLPDSRVLLVKDFDADGIRFFTNRESVKGVQLATSPVAALTFLWHPMFRQVRVRGQVEQTTREEDLEYWMSRPRESQLASSSSAQSQSAGTRSAVLAAYQMAEKEYAGSEVPLPANWGGYRLHPLEVEFWVGMPARLHDRVVWSRTAEGPGRLDTNEGWSCQRLQP